MFFRSAFLNQNALLAHAVLGAWAAVTWPGRGARGPPSAFLGLAGLCLGTGVLLDYSAVPIAVVFGGWALREGWVDGRLRGALARGAACAAGALGPILLLLAYQWAAFGSPWYPAQRYMPETVYSVRGWNGMTPPTLDLLWRNLFDLRYGLFAFCPLLIGALATPLLRGQRLFSAAQVNVALLASVALWLFNSANQFANLQWNTGVRYMVPAVPLLFMLAVPVLLALPAWGRWLLLLPSLVISWSVSMMREDVPGSLALLMRDGPDPAGPDRPAQDGSRLRALAGRGAAAVRHGSHRGAACPDRPGLEGCATSRYPHLHDPFLASRPFVGVTPVPCLLTELPRRGTGGARRRQALAAQAVDRQVANYSSARHRQVPPASRGPTLAR